MQRRQDQSSLDRVNAIRSGLWVLMALSLVLLAGCAVVDADKQANSRKKENLLWPAPPDQPRFKFEAALRSAADIVKETQDMQLRRQFTGMADTSRMPVIDKPAGIAARNGLVYVADPLAKGITVFDLRRRKLFRFGQREPNVLEKPQAVAVDAAGQVYVLDSALRKVMVFDNLGLFVYSINVAKGFTNPVAVAVSPGGETVYVVDRGDIGNADHKVVALAPDGSERFRLGPRGREEGKFNIPLAAAVGADGTLYVADAGNFRIQAFDASGKFLSAFGRPGAEPGSFSRPRSIALDPEGNIYVSDAGFNNVQIFNPAGQLLMPLGGLSREPGAGNYALIAGVAVDDKNFLYVVDHYFNKIEVYSRLSDAEGRRLMQSR